MTQPTQPVIVEETPTGVAQPQIPLHPVQPLNLQHSTTPTPAPGPVMTSYNPGNLCYHYLIVVTQNMSKLILFFCDEHSDSILCDKTSTITT